MYTMRNNLFALFIALLIIYSWKGPDLTSGLFKNTSEILVEYQRALKNIDNTVRDLGQRALALDEINDTTAKKVAFFDYITPGIHKSNHKILALRAAIQALLEKHRDQDKPLLAGEIDFLQKTAGNYRVEVFLIENDDFNDIQFQELLSRIDIIPPSLVIAQSAIESAWGTSRFARQANNYFGQRCYSKGCGLVPKQRAKNAVYEVKKFNTTQRSIDDYILNLNRHESYAQLRQIRASDRQNKNPVTGLNLAAGLNNYSERKGAYINDVKVLIKQNKLELLDAFPVGKTNDFTQ